MNTTPISLLLRLCESRDEAAWERFVALYTPLIFYWSRRLGLQEADAADLVQEVLAVLVEALPSFQSRPGKQFRGWLWTITRNKHRERERRQARQPLEHSSPLLEATAVESDVEAVDRAEYEQYLVDRALQLMQAEFEPATWKACWQFVVEGRPVADVATELNISINAVYLAKSRVLRRLREELEGLLED